MFPVDQFYLDNDEVLKVAQAVSEVPMPKGSNPKSQQNLVAGKNKRPDAVRTTVRLNPETIELAKKIGGGEITKGIDAMAKILSQFTEADLVSFLEGYGGNNVDELIADIEQNPETYEDDINGAAIRRVFIQDLPKSNSIDGSGLVKMPPINGRNLPRKFT